MILLDKKEVDGVKALLSDAIDGEECFAVFPDVGEQGCFHCRLNAVVMDIESKIAEKDQARATPIPDNDYVLSEGGAWVEYKNVVMRIYSNEVGVGVDMVYKGEEEDIHAAPVSQAFLCYEE